MLNYISEEKKIWNMKGGVEAALQQVTSEVGAVRQRQGSAPCLGALLALLMVPWKWSECLMCSPLGGYLGENGTSFLS